MNDYTTDLLRIRARRRREVNRRTLRWVIFAAVLLAAFTLIHLATGV